MSPSLARVMTKAALKSDVNNSALFITQTVEKHHIQQVCEGEASGPVQRLYFHQ